ncbi:uncharacterized protein PF3D7_1120000-like [Chironomus tepperi]|uniref:uncharacterized protein PF3D7_1120000-like n=1 Tax=Chironomus tepperi TaxID=113505 RepID=UPI00391FBC7F
MDIIATGTKGYNGSWKKIDEDFKEELDKLVDHLLKPENLAVKKVNGSALNGSEFYEYVNGQLRVFEKDELLQSQSVLQSMTMKEMEILLSACIEHYKQVGNEHRKNIQNECEIPLIHEKSKEAAMTMYNEAQKMGSSGEHENYRKVLDRKIEEIFKDLMQQLENEKRRLKEEKEKLEKEMEEKQRKEVERIQKEKEAAEEQLEKVKQESAKALELENQKKEQELAELVEKSKQEREEIEKLKEIARQAADDQIKAFHDKIEETRKLVEQRQREQNSSEQSTKDQHSNADNMSDVLKENEEPTTNIINNLPIPQNADIKLKSENESSKENDSQMQIIVAEDNVIMIEESKSDTSRSDDIADLDCSKKGQESIAKEFEQFMNKIRNTFDSSKEQSKSNPRSGSKFLASEPPQTIINIDQTTSEFVNLHETIDKVSDKISKHNLNNEASFCYFDRQPGASTSTDHMLYTGSSLEEAELADTSLNSDRRHQQDHHLDNTTMIMNQNAPIKLITFSEQNESVIYTEQLINIFGHETVKNRKIVAVLITGDEGEDKIRTLNSCLDFLYRNVSTNTIKHPGTVNF